MSFIRKFCVQSRYSSRLYSSEEGDSKSTLNELLQGFIKNAAKKESNQDYNKTMDLCIKRKKLKSSKPKIEDKIKEVANIFGKHGPQVETELKEKVEEISVINNRLKNIISEMKFDLEEDSKSKKKVSFISSKKLAFSKPHIPKEDLFSGEVLGIFSRDYLNYCPKDDSKITVVSDHWKQLETHELRLLVTHPPANYFQQLIQWTEEGKLWKFPINNEQGCVQEVNVSFAEHIFLEKHLDPWCPKRGPIRHFMELVCNGLSKNAFLTVAEKKEHIFWYKDFFESKKSLLEEIGILD